jgi:type II secretory pathway component GspD/PulD (secretin)
MTLPRSVRACAFALLLMGMGLCTARAADEGPGAKNKRIVYLVRYGSAKDLASALGKHFKGDAEFQTVTETGSNYLLISAAPAVFDEVVKTLEQLDRAPRTITVEVWVAEVIGKKGEDGKPVEGEKALDEKEFTGTIDEIQKKVDDLAKKGRIGGLKHIQLSALENQPSSALTGENKPYLVGRTVRPMGGVSNQISYRNVGLQVHVTPRITADKSLLLELKVEDARLSLPEDGIEVGVSDKGEAINAAEFTTSTLESKLTVASGKALAAEGVKSTSKGKQAQLIILVGARLAAGGTP